MKKQVLLLGFLCLFGGKLFAQSSQTSLWGAWFHTQKLSPKWGLAFDGQLRSADDVKYLRNILLRPSVAYYFDNNNHVASVGYAYITNYGRTLFDENTFRPENRIWQQYVVSHKISSNATLAHRFRLEQRFVGDLTGTDNNYFSQRLRYFARAIIPFKKDSVFTKGAFLALQNEVFLNLQNKDKVNGSLFDQNRAYIAVGYRLNKKMDIEAGYLNQVTKGFNSSYTTNNVAQVVFYTRF